MPSVTIRDIPADAHRELTARAAYSGRSLQEYLRSELIELARKPDMETLIERIRANKRRSGVRMVAEEILEYRDADRR